MQLSAFYNIKDSRSRSRSVKRSRTAKKQVRIAKKRARTAKRTRVRKANRIHQAQTQTIATLRAKAREDSKHIAQQSKLYPLSFTTVKAQLLG